MLNPSRLLSLIGVLLFTALAAGAAYADPSGRVAHLSHTQGEVSYSPAGEDEWLGVVRNRPLIRGDRLWTDRDARAEFQVGSAAVRLGSDTSVEILDLSDQIAQVRMTQGTLNLSVRRMHPGQTFEVATPTLAFTIDRAGRYRIDVDPRNAVTTVVVWDGAGEAYGDNSSFRLRAGDTVRFYDTDLRDYEMYGLPREDGFDRYCLDRDQRLDRSASLRYLEDDVVGYADLDEYGSWRPVRSYGNVWFPSRVDAGWAPYRDGHWVWQEPWGWTWVDNAPWGFAPSHYGRWVNVSNRWGWVPGPRNVRPVYAPALVAFVVGGSGWSVSISLGGGSPIGWFPLGPREVYVPSYQASRDYFKRVNVNNTVINNTTITNVYNNYSSGSINVGRVNYANRTVAGAVTAVPSTVFVNAQPVRPAAIRLDRKAVTTGEITRVAPIAPSARSVIGAAKAAEARPSREAFDRRVFVRNAPPPSERPFAVREQQLQKTPGRAPAPEAVKPAPDRADKAAQQVRVIGEQPGAVDARAAGSRRGGAKPGTPAPGQLRPLDRSVEPVNEPVREPGNRNRDKEQKGQNDAQQQQQASEKQQAERKRQAETQQQQEQQQRQREVQQQQQASEKQQAERKRQAETQLQQEQQQQQREVQQQQQDAEKKQAERKRQAETQQQQEQQQRQRQREAQQPQQASEKQQAERKRQVETQQQQEQQQRQREVQQQQQASEKQQAERKRQAETQQQQEQQLRQREVQQQQQASEKQQAERKRQVETQQQQEQQQRQREVQQQQPTSEKQQAERKRQVQTQQERQAECERQAILNHQDPSQCKIETLPKAPPGNPNRDKNGK